MGVVIFIYAELSCFAVLLYVPGLLFILAKMCTFYIPTLMIAVTIGF